MAVRIATASAVKTEQCGAKKAFAIRWELSSATAKVIKSEVWNPTV